MNLYKLLVRPGLFLLPPELANALTLLALASGAYPAATPKTTGAPIEAMGLTFRHPVGLAAGFDKNGVAIAGLFRLGFSHVEIGGVTPHPQAGNPRPRVFRATAQAALINRLGFNNDGVDFVARNVAHWRETSPPAGQILGINLAPNKTSDDKISDYILCLARLAELADYLTINVSSPNTPGLRGFQNKESLRALLARMLDARAGLAGKQASKVPLVLKIAPDLSSEALEDIVEIALSAKIDGLAIGNTTTARPADLPQSLAKETGGLSGQPLFAPSTALLQRAARLTQGRIALIGIGGIANPAQAKEKLAAGASLVQLYTGLVYEGPGLVRRIVAGLGSR